MLKIDWRKQTHHRSMNNKNNNPSRKNSRTRILIYLFSVLLFIFYLSVMHFQIPVIKRIQEVNTDFIHIAKHNAKELEEAHFDQYYSIKAQLQELKQRNINSQLALKEIIAEEMLLEKDTIPEKLLSDKPSVLNDQSLSVSSSLMAHATPSISGWSNSSSMSSSSSSPSLTTTSSTLTQSPSLLVTDFYPVVTIMAHNRPEYLERTLAALLELTLNIRAVDWRVCVSLDSPKDFERMKTKIRAVESNVVKERQTQSIVKIFELARPSGGDALAAISKHVKFALDQSFKLNSLNIAGSVELPTHVVLLEEDLLPSPDFLYYFESTVWLLNSDSTLWCISAWNDNGLASIATNEKFFYRTDYFPGLGWMIKREDWVEDLSKRWPKNPTTGWDHWIRRTTNHRNRECIYPEVPRTKHIATHGTNVNAAEQKRYDRFAFSHFHPSSTLEHSYGDLSYLLKEKYDSILQSVIKELPHKQSNIQHSLRRRGDGNDDDGSVILFSREQYHEIAKKYNLSPGEPRGFSQGILVLNRKKNINNDVTKNDSVFIQNNIFSNQIILIDRRKGAVFLSNQEAMLPNPNSIIVTAQKGTSCTQKCSTIGKKCIDRELEYVNNCESLLSHFPCEQGCGHQIGSEIPVYVSDQKASTFQQCLVTEQRMPQCNANHKYTSRLCVCV